MPGGPPGAGASGTEAPGDQAVEQIASVDTIAETLALAALTTGRPPAGYGWFIFRTRARHLHVETIELTPGFFPTRGGAQ